MRDYKNITEESVTYNPLSDVLMTILGFAAFVFGWIILPPY